MSRIHIRRIRIWQWPNLLSLDAALIAVCWQTAFAGGMVATGPTLVLALSVWLTYMADRLLDVAKRSEEQLLSIRHAFARHHHSRLWILWGVLLVADVLLALTCLSQQQLRHGLILLAVSLLYTALNQWLSKRFFPKELCVALIYAGGVIVFLEQTPPWPEVFAFALLCLCNCLMIGHKERRVDAALQVHSLSRFKGILPLALTLTGLAAIRTTPIILLPWLGLMTLTIFQNKISTECFRILADLALLLGPLAVWIG